MEMLPFILFSILGIGQQVTYHICQRCWNWQASKNLKYLATLLRNKLNALLKKRHLKNCLFKFKKYERMLHIKKRYSIIFVWKHYGGHHHSFSLAKKLISLVMQLLLLLLSNYMSVFSCFSPNKQMQEGKLHGFQMFSLSFLILFFF